MNLATQVDCNLRQAKKYNFTNIAGLGNDWTHPWAEK